MKINGSFRPAWRWIALAIVLLACVLVICLVRGARAPQRPIAETVGANRPVIRGNHERVDAHATAQPAPTQPPATSVKDELCGVSGPALFRAEDETIEQHVARVTEPSISRWKSSLAASADPRLQAIGLALANATPRPPRPGDEPSKDTPVNNSLVLLAIETDDPAIYALAISQCRDWNSGGYAMAAGPCEGLSWEHWANIDPDNAIPWLWIAAKAERASDRQGIEEALAKASSAPGIQEYGSSLSALAIAALPGDVSPLEEAVAGAEVTSISPGGAPIAIMSLCSETAIQQPARKEQCSAIATSLAKQGSTLIDLVLASRLADRLGFPQDMRTALSTEAKNARATITNGPNPWTTTGPDPWTDLSGRSRFRCDTVRGYDAFIDGIQAARGNERAALAAVGRAAQGGK
jgi:hypothetical protein